MDPNATLEELRRLIDEIQDEEWDGAGQLADKAERLAELVSALDGWLSNGGFLPKAWERP